MIACRSWHNYERERREYVRYYARFQRWVPSIGSRAFEVILSTNTQIVFPDGSLASRTERYAWSHVQEHAFMVNTVLARLGPEKFFVEHQWAGVPWFPPSQKRRPDRQRRELLREDNTAVELDAFTGGLILTPPFVAFVNAFIDWPFVQSRMSLDLFGVVSGAALVVTLSNHLTVNFTSDRPALLRQIGAWLVEMGLVQRTDIDTVFCRRDQVEWG